MLRDVKFEEEGVSLEEMSFQIDFCERLLEKNPTFVEAMIVLGELYSRKGLHEKGLGIDLRLVQLRPEDPICHYNLACSYSLLKRNTEALAALEKSIVLGYDDFQFLQKDDDLYALRQDARYQELLNKYQKKRTSQKDSL
ncbi:MAG: hypothetical protein HY590_05855 [Candidatus Omnitrophica bacterium]|nr:hypothetical protein [Candidatus Omnitrophota bacterium]